MKKLTFFIASLLLNGTLHASVYPPETLPEPQILPNDAMLYIPEKFKSCIDLLVKVQDPELTFEDAEYYVMKEKELIDSLNSFEGGKIPINFDYVIRYHETFRDEFKRLRALEMKELLNPDSSVVQYHIKRRKQPSFCLFCLYDNIDKSYEAVARRDLDRKPFTRMITSVPVLTYLFNELGVSSSNPLPDIYSLAIHKLFFMMYSSIVLRELPKMYDRDMYLDCKLRRRDMIVMEEDREKPFLEVFNDLFRNRPSSMHIICGSDIFNHFNAILPYVRYVDEDGKPVELAPESGAGGAAHT